MDTKTTTLPLVSGNPVSVGVVVLRLVGTGGTRATQPESVTSPHLSPDPRTRSDMVAEDCRGSCAAEP